MGVNAVEIVVIGGGIGGLTAALALAQGGHRVQVLERAARFAQPGPALRLAPNATAVLSRLGLLDHVLDLGSRPRRALLRDLGSGAELAELDLGAPLTARYGTPYVVIGRADLLSVLADGCADADVELRPRRAAIAVDQSHLASSVMGGAVVSCAGGQVYAGDVVLAADGVRSVARGLVDGGARAAENRPGEGWAAYRGTAPAGALAPDEARDEVVAWMGPDARCGRYTDEGWLGMTGSGSLLLRVAGMVAAVAAVASLVAGCTASTGSSATPATTGSTASSPAASPAASQSPHTAASATPSSSGSSGSSGGASASAAASGGSGNGSGTPGCAARDLSIKAGASQGAAGSLYQVLEFTNISNATCTLFGYPGVALAGGTPVAEVGAAATRSTAAAATLVTLPPGQTASTLLRISQALNYPTSKCSPTQTTYLQIYPPNQTTPVYVAYSSTGCASTSVNLLSVGVMKAGTAG
jgi:hypothetical protein